MEGRKEGREDNDGMEKEERGRKGPEKGENRKGVKKNGDKFVWRIGECN